MNPVNPPPRNDTDIPAMRLEELHGALRGGFHRPRGSALLLVAAAVLGLFYLLFSRSPQPDASASATKYVGVQGTTVDRETPREREERLRRELIAETTPKNMPPEDPVPVSAEPQPVPPGHVRVAAVQIYSVFGDLKRNRKRVAEVAGQAAKHHVNILALPEAALPGYADVTENRYWTNGKPTLPAAYAKDKGYVLKELEEKRGDKDVHFWAIENDEEDVYFELYDVRPVAETKDGESVRQMGELAKKYGMYITVPFIEKDDDRFFSSVILVDPQGRPVLHTRKQQLWETADAYWATPDPQGPPVVDTPYGRVAVAFSYGIRRLAQLSKKKVDIVLQCSALYGKGFEGTYLSARFIGAIKRAGFALAIANWTYKYTPPWEGYGMSRVILPDGRTKRIRVDDRDGIVLADIPIHKPTEKTAP